MYFHPANSVNQKRSPCISHNDMSAAEKKERNKERSIKRIINIQTVVLPLTFKMKFPRVSKNYVKYSKQGVVFLVYGIYPASEPTNFSPTTFILKAQFIAVKPICLL